MPTKVLDSYALIAFFEGEAGADKVRDLIIRAEERRIRLLICSVNLAEAWLSIARAVSLSKANECAKEIEEMAIEIVPADWAIARQAAEIQSIFNLPGWDSYAVALAKMRRAELITGHSELKVLGEQTKINWLT